MSSISKRISAVLLGLAIGGQLCAAQSDAPMNVTLHDLTTNPKKFDGVLVRVRASALIGWEGDNFLLEPHESAKSKRTFNDTSIGRVWIDCQTSKACNGLVGLRYGSGTFTGRFHYRTTESGRGNRVFDPGPFQLEVIRISDVKYGDLPTEPWLSPDNL